MGNESYISDMCGFETYHKRDEEHNISKTLYHALWENDRDRIWDIEDESLQAMLYKVFDEINQMDENIWCGIADQCMAEPPIYLGWSSVEETTPEKLEALKTLLEKEGFITERIYKDRFVTYG